MAKTTQSNNLSRRRRAPAMSPEERDDQMIAIAVDMVEEQILNRTASAQVLVHYLKLGTTKEKDRLELEKLREENKLLKAKTEKLQSEQRIEELYKKAMNAMRSYQGAPVEEEDEEDDEDIF